MAALPTSLETYAGFESLPIAATWRSGRSTRRNTDIDPYTGKTLVTIPLATTQDVDDAYQAAGAAQAAWAAAAPAERARVMHNAARIFDERREEILSWLIREAGSTRLKANIECDSARAVTLEAASFPYRVAGRILASDIPGKENRVYRRALGVIGIISPWNFPLHLTQRSLAPALALGNAVVVKPASDTPVSGGLLLAKIFEEAGLPPGVLNVVVGAGSEIGDHFVAHPQPRLISFTGSTAVGQGIGRLASSGAHLKRVALELGGNSPFVVLDDADVEQAARAAVFGRFLHQGQICMSVNRIIVDAQLHDAFVERFVARVRGAEGGRSERHRHCDRPDHRRQPSCAASSRRSRWPNSRAPPSCWAASPTGSCCRRMCSLTSRPTARCSATNRSDPSCRSCARRTRPTRCGWPMPPITACPARCSAATSIAACASPSASRRA